MLTFQPLNSTAPPRGLCYSVVVVNIKVPVVENRQHPNDSLILAVRAPELAQAILPGQFVMVAVADRGMVNVDLKTLKTSSKNVYAAGDVIGAPALASTSMEQAQRAVSAMFSEKEDNDCAKRDHHEDPLSIGVWTIPEMGYYGYTKETAEKEGYNVVEGIVSFDECLRGRVFAPDGLLKLVVDTAEGTVLGVHLIGKDAAEMAHYGMALVKAGTTIFEMLQTVYTAVTFHELFKEAALDANSKLDFGVEWQEIFNVLQPENAPWTNFPTST